MARYFSQHRRAVTKPAPCFCRSGCRPMPRTAPDDVDDDAPPPTSQLYTTTPRAGHACLIHDSFLYLCACDAVPAHALTPKHPNFTASGGSAAVKASTSASPVATAMRSSTIDTGRA